MLKKIKNKKLSAELKNLPQLIAKPTKIKAHGNKPKLIHEFVGRINSKTSQLSIAQMISPQGWSEPGQTPDFDEYSFVLKGILRAETGKKAYLIKPSELFIARKGNWIRYSTPYKGGATYVAICIPAFSEQAAHRDQK